MPRGRAAALPTGGHVRPAVQTGLLVTHVTEKGDETATYDFSLLPVPETLQMEFAALFARRVTPTGTWRSIPTSRGAWYSVLRFCRMLAALDRVPTRVADIEASVWRRWRLTQVSTVAGQSAMQKVSTLLLDDPTTRPDTRRELSRRLPARKSAEPSYSDEELRQIEVTARRIFRLAETRIKANVEHLNRFWDGEFTPGSDDHLLGEALDHLSRTGDVPYRVHANGLRAPLQRYTRVLGGVHRDQTWKRLFLDEHEVAAMLVLLACKEGWNFTTINELQRPERITLDPEPPMYRVELEKRRRNAANRYETRTLTDNAPNSTGRLLTRFLRVLAPTHALLEAVGQPSERLFVFHVRKGLIVDNPADLFRSGVSNNATNDWRKQSGSRINFRRIRKAVNVRRRREPNQNTRSTHDSVYVLRDPHTVAESEALIARGVQQAIEHAGTVEAAVKPDDSDAGEDTATAACVEPLQSPFSPWGVPCAASFLLCLACVNAVVMPKHLGRLAYLYEVLTGLRTSISPEDWERNWAAHYARLHNLRTEHYSEEQWRDALDDLTDADRLTVDHLLKGDLDS